MNRVIEPILRISNLNKHFTGVHALKGVDLEIQRGEVHALLGENGAGKSTLVKIISGVYQRSSGEIVFDSLLENFSSPREAFQKGISMIYQETSLIPELTVLENVFLGSEFSTSIFGIIDEKKSLQKFKEVSEQLNFRLPPKRKVRELSIAQQKMVEILKAMVHETKFIIMDEPSDSLAENEVRQLHKIVRDLKNSGVPVLYITHYLEEVFEVCDRLTVLRDGKKVATTSTAETDRESVIKMMVGGNIFKDLPTSKKNWGQTEAIRVENISRKNAVHDVSFTAHKGEILGITGIIGAGKTELVRLLSGADRMDYGKVFIDGSPCVINSPIDAVKNGIGFLPEDRKHLGLILDHSIYKNMTLGSLYRFLKNGIISRKEELKQTKTVVDKLNIKISDPKQAVKFLSGGNQQKVVIGKLLLSNPNVLIMDEPTRGIDIGAKAEIYKIMRELADAGHSIIYVTSEIPEVVKVSDRILVMKKGRVTAEFQHGITQEAITKYLLEEN